MIGDGLAELALAQATPPNEWAAPVDFDAPTYGPGVPLEALPPSIAAYVREVAASVQVSEDFVTAGALGVLAAAGARRAEVQIGSTHREPVNLYLSPVAESGERKHVIRATTFPLEEEERRLHDNASADIAERAQTRAITEKRIKYLQDQAAKDDDLDKRQRYSREATQLQQELPTVPAAPRLLFDDATPEEVARALAQQGGRAAIISEEAGSLFEVLGGRYSNGTATLDVHLKAYDGGTIRVDRVTREPVLVPRPALTILVTPQPTLLEHWGERPEFRGRGLLARFAFVLAPSRVGKRLYRDRGIAEATRASYAESIATILKWPLADLGEEPTALQIDGTALEVWRTYADETEQAQADGKRLAGVRDWASKHAGRVARIAGLFHMCTHAPRDLTISAETVAAAWAIGQWLEAHALAAFAWMGAHSDQRRARWVLEWIRRHRHEQFTLRDLHQHHRRVDRPEDLLPALRILESRGFLRQKPDPDTRRPGRPRSPAFTVHPATHSHNSLNATESVPDEPLREFCDPGGAK